MPGGHTRTNARSERASYTCARAVVGEGGGRHDEVGEVGRARARAAVGEPVRVGGGTARVEAVIRTTIFGKRFLRCPFA